MSKNYDTFKEIDFELKKLKLRSQIDKEKLKLSIHELKKSASPGNLVGGVVKSAFSSGLAVKLLAPVAMYGIGKLTEKKDHKDRQKKRWWPFG